MSKVVIKNEAEQIIIGVIAEPFVLDTDMEFHFLEGILSMYTQFVLNNLELNIDLEHDEQKTGSEMLRTYIALSNDPDGYPRGTWVGECKVCDELWPDVLSGKINGFSAHFACVKVDVDTITDMLVSASGSSEESLTGILPPHTHPVKLKFNDKGKVVSGECGEVMGHTHKVVRAAHTETTLDHLHRLLILK